MAINVMNAVEVTVNSGAIVKAGFLPFEVERLRTLRGQSHSTHLVRRGGENGERIICVPFDLSSPIEGMEAIEYDLSKEPWLIVSLLEDALIRRFRAMNRVILNRNPVTVLSEKPANLFPAFSKRPDWLQRRVVLEFECRQIDSEIGSRRALMFCDRRARNFIKADCAELANLGISAKSYFVSRRYSRPDFDPRIEPRLKLAGRVIDIDGADAILEEHGEGPNRVPLNECYLEARHDSLDYVLRILFGNKAESFLQSTEQASSSFYQGPDRLTAIQGALAVFDKYPLELAQGIHAKISSTIGSDGTRWFFSSKVESKPDLVFHPGGTHTDRWSERGLDKFGPIDQRSFTPKRLNIAVICQARFAGQTETFMARLLEGLPDVTRFGSQAKPFENGFLGRFRLEKPYVKLFETRTDSFRGYDTICNLALQHAEDESFQWDLAIVQIEPQFRQLPNAQNPYFTTKALFLRHKIPVQEVTTTTITQLPAQVVYSLNNMSLAMYAKIGGTPWLLKSTPTIAHELVIGLGSHTVKDSRYGAGRRYVGITTVFRSDGRYLLDDRTSAVPYEQYSEALYQTLSRAIRKAKAIDDWRPTDDVRLIFHVFKPLRNTEAENVEKVIAQLGMSQVKFAFVHVVDEHPYCVFDISNEGKKAAKGAIKGRYAAERGLVVKLSDHDSLVSFTGAGELKQAHHGLPKPALLRLHRASSFTDMTYLARQAFDFTCHSWQMFSPAPLPITIHYSELIARLLVGLGDVPNWAPDSTIGLGPSRWFL